MKTERILWQVVLVVFISACQFTDAVPLFPEATPTSLPTSISSDNPVIEGGQDAPLLPPIQSIQNFPPEVDFSIEGAGNIIAPDGIFRNKHLFLRLAGLMERSCASIHLKRPAE
ncbi:MAG: hypothetical protein IPN58_19415 [Anaerolineales bacterium]|nr:hypothetical protein [Anaerolineales bacterium]